MMGRSWFKMWASTREDSKLSNATDHEYRYWLQLLCLSCETTGDGTLDVSDKEGVCFDIGLARDGEALMDDFDEITAALVRKRIIKRSGDTLIFPGWERRQGKPSDRPEAVRERVKKHRSNAASNAKGVTKSHGVTPTEAEEETEEETERAARATFDECFDAYPLHRYRDRASDTFDDAVASGVDPDQLLAACKRAPKSTIQSLGFFISDGTWRDYLPKPRKSKAPSCPECGGNGWVLPRDSEVAVPCPQCSETKTGSAQ